MPELDQILDDDRVPYEELRILFEQAWVKDLARYHRLNLSIAGKLVHIEIVGNELAANIEHTFTHLKTVNTGTPALTIDIWDEHETGIQAQRSVNQQADNQPDMVMKTSRDGRYIGEERRHRNAGLTVPVSMSSAIQPQTNSLSWLKMCLHSGLNWGVIFKRFLIVSNN